MSMRERGVHGHLRLAAVLALGVVFSNGQAAQAVQAVAGALGGDASTPTTPRLGRPIIERDAAGARPNVFPDGRGLPAGRGNATEGAALFAEHCQSCHGPGGRGATAEELAGGRAALNSESPDKTIGLYWPHATTIFDFTRRAMPMNAPAVLSDDQVYALTAYLLHANGLIGVRDEMNASTLPRVKMPNRRGFDFIDAAP